MPVSIAAELYDHIDFYSTNLLAVGAALALLAALRVWSGTPRLRVRRVLHGRTVVISGGLTPLNLSLTRSLASQGAQIILLVKDPGDAILQQLLHLIRSTTENERIYAEPCDCSASTSKATASIRAFAKKWSTTRKQSPLGDDLGPENIDTLILSDDESLRGANAFGASSSVRGAYYTACLRGKVALLEGLLPVFKSSGTRVVNVVDPFYAASPPLPIYTSALDGSEPSLLVSKLPWRPYQPWTFSSPFSLASISIVGHLATLCTPPSTSEAHALASQSRKPNVTFASASTGLTRSWIFSTLMHSGVIGWILCIVLSPIIWAAGKSTEAAATEVERVVHGDFVDIDKHPQGVPSGSLIVGGRTIVLRRTEWTDASVGEALWNFETAALRWEEHKRSETSKTT